MAEVSRPWKPAVKLEPEETLASYVFNYSVVLTPTHVQKKRRVHSSNNMPGTFPIRRNQDKNMTLSRVPSGNTMQWIHKSNEKQDQDQFRTARQRFVLEDEEIEATTPLAPSFASKFKPVQPKLSTSKSEGRANVLPSRRRRQFQQDQVSQSTKRSVNRAPVQDQGLGRDDSFEDTFLAREKMIHRCFGVLEHNQSCGPFTSISSYEPSEAAGTLEQGFMSSMTYASSTVVMDEMLVTVAQRAKKELETISKRQVMEEGRWKRIARSKPECQSFESISKAKDQYSVLVEMDLPCSLREIMSVYSTDNLAEFHRSMEAIFGDQYVYGVNIRTADCASIVEECNSVLRSRPQGRRASAPATSHGYEESICTNVSPLRSAKLHVNAVTLMQKHHLVWKQRNMTFMDYLEENIETKSVTRVMQTMDMQDEDLECSLIAMSSPTAVSSNLECLFQQHTQHGIDLRRELKGILAGYIIQEDSNEKLTRVFFHATHHHRPSSWHGPTRMPRSAVQLLRAMVNKVCLLETVILRRRLGYYPLTRLPTCSDVALRCAACCVPFNMLRKRYVCRLCGHHTCRKCSDVQEVEKTVGQVEKHRVCASCVRRVSYCVFSMCAFPPKTASNVSDTSRTSPRSSQPIERNVEDDDFDPPIMDDLASNDFEHVEVFHSNQNGVFAGFVSRLLHDKDKKRDIDSHRKQDFTAQGRQNLTAAKRRQRQRLQLNIDDLNPWAPGPPPLDGQNTPKESICILDSFGISDPSTSSRLRELPSSSPTEA